MTTTWTHALPCASTAEVIPWQEVERAACALQRVPCDSLFGVRGTGVAHKRRAAKQADNTGNRRGKAPTTGQRATVNRSGKAKRVRKVGYMVKQGQRFKTWQRR